MSKKWEINGVKNKENNLEEDRKGETRREKTMNGARQEKNEIKKGMNRNEEKKREEMGREKRV